jgi:hypothetical protein
MHKEYLESTIKQFKYYQLLGEKAFEQVADDALFWQYNKESNSIAVIVHHLGANMLSRWTDFLTADGEKEWRNRDKEFENTLTTRGEMMYLWKLGWDCLYRALYSLKEEHLDTIIYIRNQGHTVTEAINRQLAHYPYHIGQIVFIAKMAALEWTSLSIPKGQSCQYNSDKFAQPKKKQHFTDDAADKEK